MAWLCYDGRDTTTREGKVAEKEYRIDGEKIDVAWKRIKLAVEVGKKHVREEGENLKRILEGENVDGTDKPMKEIAKMMKGR